MKATLNRNHRTGIKHFSTPRVRLMPIRRSSRLRAPAPSAATAPSPLFAEPLTAQTEPVPTESLHGDTLLLYLREIGQVKLLTPQEEITLARRIRRGDKKAREQMITANLRLVVKIARDYAGLSPLRPGADRAGEQPG